MIDVRQLSYFIAVVEAKSLTAAADVLLVAQPALSQHLQRLEYEFGQQLLVRHSRGVEPTEAGLRLVEHARAILTMVETAKNDLRNFNEQPRGRVLVGMPHSLCDELAIELMATWPQQYPNIDLQIVELPSNSLPEAVLAGRLDLAVTSFPSDSSMVIAEPLFQDKMCAVMRGPRGVSDISEIRFAELAREPLILYSASNVCRQLIDMTAKYSSVPLNVAYEIDSPALAIKMVEANLGSTIQPYLAVRSYMHSGRAAVRLIVEPGVTRRLHLIRARQRPLTANSQQVIQALKSQLVKHLAADSPLLELDLAADS